MNDKRQLLCTFSNIAEFKDSSEQIYKFYKVYNNCIFAFYNVKSPKELFLTYNIVNEETEFPKFPNTISIHRKKQTNTLYSLNALNTLIKEENGGTLDKTFQLKWEYYKDSLVISSEVSVRIIPIKIYDILYQNS
jgi:hypothetical protein